jgi:YVTN family beta-propeller protein
MLLCLRLGVSWMQAAAVVASACLLSTNGAAHEAERTAAERIYVLSQTGAKLTEIEEEAGKASSSIPLGKAPAALALAPDSALAYVTHPDIGKVSVVDLAERRVDRMLEAPGSPFGIAAASGGRIYVADWNGGEISVIETAGSAPSKTVKVGRAPAHLLLTPDQSLLFVANRESDTVSAIRTADLTLAGTISVGRAPFAMALSPDAKRLYVGNVQAGTISVIDTGALVVIETRKSGAMPYGAAVTPDGARVLVTNQQSGTVAVLAGQDAPPGSIRVGGYPEGIAIGVDGRHAYAANWFSDDVSVLDLESLREIRRIKCPGGPRSVVISHRKH